MNKILVLICSTTMLSTCFSLYPMETKEQRLLICDDDSLTAEPRMNHASLPQYTWNDLSFDLAELIGYHLSALEKLNARETCQAWRLVFRHPAQSYGRGSHFRVTNRIKQKHIVFSESITQSLLRLVKRIKSRPQPREDDSIALTVRGGSRREELKKSKIVETFFELLHGYNLTSLIKRISLYFDGIPLGIMHCKDLVSLKAMSTWQGAIGGLGICSHCPLLQELDLNFHDSEHKTSQHSLINSSVPINLSLVSVDQLCSLAHLQVLHIYSKALQFDAAAFFLLLDTMKNLKELSVGVVSRPELDEQSYTSVQHIFGSDHTDQSSLKTVTIKNNTFGPLSSFFLERICFHAPHLNTLSIDTIGEGFEHLKAFSELDTLILLHELSSPTAFEQLLQTGLGIKNLQIELSNAQMPPPNSQLLPFQNLEHLSFRVHSINRPNNPGKLLCSLCPGMKELSIHLYHNEQTKDLINLLEELKNKNIKQIRVSSNYSWQSELPLYTFVKKHKNMKLSE